MGLFRCGAWALLVMAGLPAPASASDWVGLTASYAVSVAGIPIGRLDFGAQINARAYRLSGTGHMEGLGRLVSSGHGTAESHGAFKGDRVLPTHYSYSEVAPPKTISIDMDMAGGDVQRLSVSPPVEPSPDRIPITEQHKRGVVDPMSALLFHPSPDGPLLSPAACARAIPVFDGRQRFDIELSYAGMHEVRTPQGYHGPVVVCRAGYRPIAGHRPAKKEVRQVEANRTIEAWLAPIEGTRVLVPYRVSIRTIFGDAVVEAERFEAQPVTRQAAAP